MRTISHKAFISSGIVRLLGPGRRREHIDKGSAKSPERVEFLASPEMTQGDFLHRQEQLFEDWTIICKRVLKIPLAKREFRSFPKFLLTASQHTTEATSPVLYVFDLVRVTAAPEENFVCKSQEVKSLGTSQIILVYFLTSVRALQETGHG